MLTQNQTHKNGFDKYKLTITKYNFDLMAEKGNTINYLVSSLWTNLIIQSYSITEKLNNILTM